MAEGAGQKFFEGQPKELDLSGNVKLKDIGLFLKEKILANMSSRAAATLREDLESRGPMRLSEVEAQQKEVLKTVRRLAHEGQIVIGGGGGDDAMV